MPSKNKSKSKKSKSQAKAEQATPEVQDVPEAVESVQEQPAVEQTPVKSKSKKKKTKSQSASDTETAASDSGEPSSSSKKTKKTKKKPEPVQEEPAQDDAPVAEKPASVIDENLTRSQAIKQQRRTENSMNRTFTRATKMLNRIEKPITKSGNEKDMQNFQNVRDLLETLLGDFQRFAEYTRFVNENSRPKKKSAGNTSGYVEKKPQPKLYMSPELKTLLSAVKADEFNVGEDNMIQRGEAVRGISLYIKENDLKNTETKEIEYRSKSKDNMLYTLKEVTRGGKTAQIQTSKGENVAIASPKTKSFTQKDIFSLVAGHVSKEPF